MVSGPGAAVATMNPRPLSPREQQVVALVAEGLTNDEIGDKLYLTSASVKTHLERAGKKAHTRSRAALVNWAWQHNYIGDRADLQDQIDSLTRRILEMRTEIAAEEVEELRNTIENLQAMYATACGFQGWTP
jgi:DNA-binding CsgD family transcriptional regulator